MDRYSRLAVLGASKDALIFAHLFCEVFDEEITLYCNTRKEKERIKRKTMIIDGETIILPNKLKYAYHFDFLENRSYLFFIDTLSNDKFVEITKKLIKSLDAQCNYGFLLAHPGILKKSLRKKHKITTHSEYLKGLLEENKIHHHSIGFIQGFNEIRDVIRHHPTTLGLTTDTEHFGVYIKQKLQHKQIHWLLQRKEEIIINSTVKSEILAIIFELCELIVNVIRKTHSLGTSAKSLLMEIALKELLTIAGHFHIPESKLLLSSNFTRIFFTDSHEKHRDHIRYLARQRKHNVWHRVFSFLGVENQMKKRTLTLETISRGALLVPPVLELAEERDIKLGFLKQIYEILYHKKNPDILWQQLDHYDQASTSLPDDNLGNKQVRSAPNLYSIAGRNLEYLLLKRINDTFLQEYSSGEKIKNQASMIIDLIEKRIKKIEKKRNFALKRDLRIELKLWKQIQDKPVHKLEKTFNRLTQFYIRNITDHFKPGLKTILYILHFPIRWILHTIKRSPYTKIEGEIQALYPLMKNSTFVYVPSHKSHLDSIEITLTLLKKKLPIPRYAAASSLMTNRFWSLILRTLGAFSVDRQRSQNILYLECLRYYSETLLYFGVPTLIFPEGTRSRSGALLQIKTGLLASVIEAYRNSRREIAVIPVCLSYSNVPEDHEFCKIAKKTKLGRYLMQRRTVFLHFSKPLLISQYADTADGKSQLAQDIMTAWKRHQKIQPSQLIAYLLNKKREKLQLPIDQQITLTVNLADLKNDVHNFLVQNPTGNYSVLKSDKIITLGLLYLQRHKILATPVKEKKGNGQLKIIVDIPKLLAYYARMIANNESRNIKI